MTGVLVLALAAVLVGLATGGRAAPTPQFTIVNLGTLGGTDSSAVDINAAGQVVGSSTTATGERHAFIWTTAGGMVDLGTLGGQPSYAFAINSVGQVVGQSATASGEAHAFSWTQAGGMVDLGTLGGTGSSAADVNDVGQVVGFIRTANGEQHPSRGRKRVEWSTSARSADSTA